MLWPKKNSYKEFGNEKKFLRLENSPPFFSVRVRLIEVSAELGFVIKENMRR